ncbi:hypothetical protein HNY73_013989 [Argiope bruennichi]|uniref:Reverse transcriptase domain-containing protein n=1 Tax=Argiope bruennichi TaxID=94029 RepID=A0A8T0EP72_ARGBR|nr:hypothetical protein HNY73_013989 [Argiope bruennichi]
MWNSIRKVGGIILIFREVSCSEEEWGVISSFRKWLSCLARSSFASVCQRRALRDEGNLCDCTARSPRRWERVLWLADWKKTPRVDTETQLSGGDSFLQEVPSGRRKKPREGREKKPGAFGKGTLLAVEGKETKGGQNFSLSGGTLLTGRRLHPARRRLYDEYSGTLALAEAIWKILWLWDWEHRRVDTETSAYQEASSLRVPLARGLEDRGGYFKLQLIGDTLPIRKNELLKRCAIRTVGFFLSHFEMFHFLGEGDILNGFLLSVRKDSELGRPGAGGRRPGGTGNPAEKITGLTPNVTLDVSKMKIPKFMELSDPQFFEAKEIHALLNADLFFRIMKDNVYRVNEKLLFRETEFGWIASGRLEEAKTIDALESCFLLINNSIEDTLKQFFDLESLGIRDDPCIHEDQALKLFNNTVQYNNGRYIVELSFHKHIKELSDNLIVAKQRFQNLWRRLQKDTDLHLKYEEIIQDYLNQGIIKKVDSSELCKDKPIYYLPHQVVKKEGRVTTSTLIAQQNSNIIRHSTGFSSIAWRIKHKDAVRFLWTPSDPRTEKRPVLEVYRFNRVIFGVNASPFLLAATVKHHINKYEEEYPITVKHLDSYMYVDDWITGQDTREEALLISRHAKNIMKEAGMEMRKWISNDSTLMNQWVAEGFDTYPIDTSVCLGSNKTKVLGMAWQTQDDCFTLDTTSLLEFITASKITKRSLLQAIGKIFDPLGLLTPFTIRVKCLIQELWEKKITWDEILPPKIVERWLEWCRELPLLDELKIPRLVLDSTNDEKNDTIEIHVFCDASKLAYVAPLKSVTLPRLELLGALVASRLSSKVQGIIGQKKDFTVFHWTDSKIVLYWIKGSHRKWKQFVKNRVQEITGLTNPNTWFHCPGKDNPSDFLSRGLSAKSLICENKWWNGPSFLLSDELPETICECPEPDEKDYLPELKSENSNIVLTLNSNKTFFDYLINRSNRFLTIVRILSYLFRFMSNCRNQEKKKGSLTSEELSEAENYLLKQCQLEEFSAEVISLMSHNEISNKNVFRWWNLPSSREMIIEENQ